MYQARIDRVLQAMKAMGLEQMIVSDPDSKSTRYPFFLNRCKSFASIEKLLL